MSEASEIARQEIKRKSGGSRREPTMLPQWALETLRPAVRVFCRALWRVRFEGLENIPQDGGLIIAANHQTYVDPFWVSLPLKRPVRYLAWDEAFNWPIVGTVIGLLGAWPLQIEGSDPAPIRRSLQWLREGGAVVIFPEGGRGKPDGSLIRFKNGAVRMALEARVPILPATIRGGHQVWPSTKTMPRPGRVEIIYHETIQITPQPGEDTRACARRETERLAEIIGSAL